jgi:ubiquinol-cytochrome c reductase cytochrome b subunit
MVLAALAIVHLVLLHKTGSSNPIGTRNNIEKTYFHPFFSSKDFTPILIVASVIIIIATQAPFKLSDPENFSEANPLTTPTHIQPEWYFLFAYAILRSIPSKLGGVIALVISIAILALPAIKRKKKTDIKNRAQRKTKILNPSSNSSTPHMNRS